MPLLSATGCCQVQRCAALAIDCMNVGTRRHALLPHACCQVQGCQPVRVLLLKLVGVRPDQRLQQL